MTLDNNGKVCEILLENSKLPLNFYCGKSQFIRVNIPNCNIVGVRISTYKQFEKRRMAEKMEQKKCTNCNGKGRSHFDIRERCPMCKGKCFI